MGELWQSWQIRAADSSSREISVTRPPIIHLRPCFIDRLPDSRESRVYRLRTTRHASPTEAFPTFLRRYSRSTPWFHLEFIRIYNRSFPRREREKRKKKKEKRRRIFYNRYLRPKLHVARVTIRDKTKQKKKKGEGKKKKRYRPVVSFSLNY